MGNQNLDASAISVKVSGSTAFITINRPERSNSYTQEMLSLLEDAFECADKDESIRVIVFTGAGSKSFCAGADRTEIQERSWRSVLFLKSAAVFNRICKSRKVTIAAINGHAVGGGFELALCCDLRIASPQASFWLPEPEFGILPAAAATNLLPKLVGILQAKDLILGGARWNSDVAMRAGLLSAISPEGVELMVCVNEWISRISSRDADALFLAKQAIDMSGRGIDTMQFDLLAQAFLVSLQSNQNK